MLTSLLQVQVACKSSGRRKERKERTMKNEGTSKERGGRKRGSDTGREKGGEGEGREERRHGGMKERISRAP